MEEHPRNSAGISPRRTTTSSNIRRLRPIQGSNDSGPEFPPTCTIGSRNDHSSRTSRNDDTKDANHDEPLQQPTGTRTARFSGTNGKLRHVAKRHHHEPRIPPNDGLHDGSIQQEQTGRDERRYPQSSGTEQHGKIPTSTTTRTTTSSQRRKAAV